MPRYPAFIGGSNPTQSTILDGSRTVNLYVETVQGQGGANTAALLPTPGFTKLVSVADVGGRGAINAGGRVFVIWGSGLYEIDVNFTATKRGTVDVDGNPAQFIYNGTVGGQLGIASGGSFYYYVLATNTLTKVLSGEANQIAYAGGYGFAFNSSNGKVRLSNLNDLSTWNSGTFFQRSLFADPWQAMFVDANNLLWMIGTDTFEAWYNTGSGTQPWAPLSGLVGRWGIAAPFAFAATGLGNAWLSRNPEGTGQLVITRGSSPVPVSTYGVNTAIAAILRTSQIADAECLTYQQEGHTFLNLAFPSAPATWTFDMEGQSWTERGKWNPTRGAYDLWAPRVHVYGFSKHMAIDRTTGTLWAMDTNVATETDGTGIRRLRRAPHLNVEHKRIPLDQFELLMDVGLGVASGQGSDPQVMMRLSTDGGRTFHNERLASVGKIGEYRKRVYWTRLGAPPDAVIEVSFSEPIPFRVVDAWVNNAEGMAA